jgi:alpha-tubulin suppressor-like RCC1 family protein
VVSISTGRGLSLALKEDGTVGVLGGNHYEAAEYAKQLKDIKSVAAGFFVGGAVKEDGTLIIWGREAEELYKNDDLEKLVLYEVED